MTAVYSSSLREIENRIEADHPVVSVLLVFQSVLSYCSTGIASIFLPSISKCLVTLASYRNKQQKASAALVYLILFCNCGYNQFVM